MSDGPHRTLSLRQHWRQVAKCAYTQAFDSQDVIDAFCPALERDFWWEVPNELMKELRGLCEYEAPSLFGDELDRLKRVTSGRGTLATVLAQCAASALAEGKTGNAALRQAIKNALLDRAVRN